MPDIEQAGESQHRASRRDEIGVEPRGFLDPETKSDESYDTAAGQGGAYWYRTNRAATEGIDDEDASFGGYDTGRAA
jgi:hypothetical protein